MNDRRGVLLVLYDLPVKTRKQRRDAARFRKKLTSLGFMALQKSVYVKLIRNDSMADREMGIVKSLAPPDGTVNALPLSLNVFRQMRALKGNNMVRTEFADDMVVI